MTVEGEGGQDAVQVISASLEEYGKRITREAMTVWNTAAQERVMEAASQRSTDPPEGDSENKEYRRNNNLHELAQEFTVPVWNDEDGKWEFANTHVAAKFHEWGAMPHEIRAKRARALVFEWPDMPQEVREKFEKQWASTTNSLEEPEVAFNSVNHPGTPAIGYMRHGREEARKYLEDQGLSTEAFVSGGDD